MIDTAHRKMNGRKRVLPDANDYAVNDGYSYESSQKKKIDRWLERMIAFFQRGDGQYEVGPSWEILYTSGRRTTLALCCNFRFTYDATAHSPWEYFSVGEMNSFQIDCYAWLLESVIARTPIDIWRTFVQKMIENTTCISAGHMSNNRETQPVFSLLHSFGVMKDELQLEYNEEEHGYDIYLELEENMDFEGISIVIDDAYANVWIECLKETLTDRAMCIAATMKRIDEFKKEN